MTGERRGSPRYVAADVAGVLAVRVRPGIEATLVDLGAGGAVLETERRLLPGRFVHVQMIERNGITTVRARVLRTDVTRLTAMAVVYRCAIAFDQPAAFAVIERPDSRREAAESS